MGGTGSSFNLNAFFGQLFDKASGVFDRVADLELGKYELELAQEYRLLGLDSIRDNTPATPSTSGFLGIGSGETETIILLLLLAGGGYALYRAVK